MKNHIYALSVLFLLAACGGGGGGGGSNAITRQPVVNNNSKVTSLSTTVDNRAEIIAFVEDKLGENYYAVDGQGGDRPSPRTGTTNNRVSSLTSDAYNKYIQRYRSAYMKLADMDTLLKKNRTELTEFLESDTKAVTRLIDSLTLAGITVPENATNEQLLDLAGTLDYDNDVRPIIDANAFKTVKLDEVDLAMTKSSQFNKKMYKFTISSNGQITGVRQINRDRTNTTDPWGADQEIIEMTRVGDTSSFVARTDKSGGYVEDEITIESYGKKVGLSFTDFGNIIVKSREYDTNGDLISNNQHKDAFVGGYDYKKIADTTIAANMVADTEMNFTGHATGYVANHDSAGNNNGNEIMVDGSATLNFKANGEQTLKANFSEAAATGATAWYDTVLTKNTDGTYDIAFNNSGGVSIDAKYQAADASDINNVAKPGMDSVEKNGNMTEINYYGDAGNPSEASGMIHHTQKKDTDEYLELRSSFGVKKVD